MSGILMRTGTYDGYIGEAVGGGERPPVFRADRLEQDRNLRLATTKFIGEVLTETEGTIELLPEDEMSLVGAVKEVVRGNLSVMPNIRRNAMTAGLEGIYKTGHVIKTESDIVDGVAIQFGQSHRGMYRNSLKYTSKSPKMSARTHAETLNGSRIDHYIQTRILDTHYLVVPSLVPDDMTEEEAAESSFFVENMTAVLQASTVEGQTLNTESAFWAGRKNKDAPRHDFAAIQKLYEYFGESAEGLSTTQLITSPLLIPKELMPNGVVDIVKILDQFSGGFFGMDQPPQDYIAFLDVCKEREANLEDTTTKVVQDLIAAAPSLHEPIDAIEKLYELVKKHVIAYVVDDESIDITVFGETAAQKIQEARVHKKAGNEVAMLAAVQKATDEAIFTMCDGGKDKKKSKSSFDSNSIETQSIAELNALDANENDNSGRIRCFKCRSYVDKKDVVKDDTWCCPKCNYEVDVCTGEVVNDGKTESKENTELATVSYIQDILKTKREKAANHAEPQEYEPVEHESIQQPAIV